MCLIVVLSFIIAYGSTISRTVITAIDSYLMICCHAVSEYHVLPVRIVSSQIAFHFLLITEDITHAHQVRIINSGVGIRVGIVGGPFFQLYIFGAIHYVIFFNSNRKTIVAAITNVDFSLVSTFRRD